MFRSLIRVEEANDDSVKLIVPAWDSDTILQYRFVVMPKELQKQIKNGTNYFYSWATLEAEKGDVKNFQIDFGRWQSVPKGPTWDSANLRGLNY